MLPLTFSPMVDSAKLARLLANPSLLWYALRVRARGLLFRWWCKLFHSRITIGRNFQLDGRLSIRGPGKVIIGDNVVCGMHVTIYTYDQSAVVRIGAKVFLNGTRFGCKQSISVGDGVILADCRILDTDFHSIDPTRRNDPQLIKVAPITIEENVWITSNCYILKGVTIGRNSTISVNSVVFKDIPADSIAGGNPATVWRSLDQA